MDIDLWEQTRESIKQNRLEEALAHLEHGLANCESPRFKGLLGADFTNNPESIAEHINSFIEICEAKFPVEAIYFEMNGFSINVDLWYFDSFGYRRYVETPHDLEWLPYWNSDDFPALELPGLEAVQSDYDWYSFKQGHEDQKARAAESFACLLVMCKFARLIGRTVATKKIKKRLPILASAHDFDIIPQFQS